MSKKLPPFGFAEDILGKLPPTDPSDPEQIERFVDAVAESDAAEPQKQEVTLQFITFSLDGTTKLLNPLSSTPFRSSESAR